MRRALMVGVAVALVGGPLATAEPAAAAPTVTVTPSTGLVDLDTVDVIASGFAPNATIGVCQGIEEAPAGPEDCIRPFGLFQADADGGAQLELTVRRFGFRNGQTVDCLAQECVIGVADIANVPGTVVNTPISFAPPPPPPSERGTVEVTPDEALGEQQAVEVVGTGFRPGVTVEVLQCVAAPDDPTDCGASFEAVTVETDGTGGFATSLLVTSQLALQGQAAIDCRLAPGNCVVAAAEVVDVPGTIVSAPLSFVLLRPDLQVRRISDGVIFFDDVYAPPAPIRRHTIQAGGRWSYALIAQNDGNVTDLMALTSFAEESDQFDVDFFLFPYNITELVNNGDMELRLAPGQSLPFVVRFTAAPGVPIGERITIPVNLFSLAEPQHFDHIDLEVVVAAPTM